MLKTLYQHGVPSGTAPCTGVGSFPGLLSSHRTWTCAEPGAAVFAQSSPSAAPPWKAQPIAVAWLERSLWRHAHYHHHLSALRPSGTTKLLPIPGNSPQKLHPSCVPACTAPLGAAQESPCCKPEPCQEHPTAQ